MSTLTRNETMPRENEKELEILSHILKRAESVHQRDLAQIVGLR